MNLKERADEIFNQSTENKEKIRLLNELLVDCLNEMEAQDQNMRPEVHHQLAEGYRVAKNYIRYLEGA